MRKTCMKGMLEAYSKNSKPCSETLTKHETTMEVDSVGCLVSKQTKDYFSLDSDYSWIKDDNARPWWKTIDREELACLVSKKLLNYIENWDLPPPPQKKYLGEQSYSDISDYNIKTCFDCKAKSSVFSNLTVEPKEGLDSGKIEPPSNRGHLSFSSDKSTRYFQFSSWIMFADVLLIKLHSADILLVKNEFYLMWFTFGYFLSWNVCFT
jgi:hypothetical protein